MSRILIAACALVALASCAPQTDANGDGIADGTRSPDSVSLIAPSTPVGTVSGVVVNTLQGPIEGVAVKLVLGEGKPSYSANTAADGSYTFKDVPAGGYGQLLFSKTGYSSARISTYVPAYGGNFPINQGNGNAGVVTLTQQTATLKFHVYTATGAPAKGAKAILEVSGTAFETEQGTYGGVAGNYSGSAEVDDTGLLTFTNAPEPAELARIPNAGNFMVTIGALDVDGDGRADSLGSVNSYPASGLFTNPDRTIILGDARTTAALTILASNLDSFNVASNSPPYRNALKANDPITIVFNQPITQVDSTRLVKVVQEDCETNVAVTVTQRTPNTLSIAPVASWTLGNRYNIVVRATGLDSGVTNDFIGYFFAIDPSVPRPLSTSGLFQITKSTANMMANALQPGDRLSVEFDTPIAYMGTVILPPPQPATAPLAYAQFAFDLNGDGTIGGTIAGENNNTLNAGFSFTMDEQVTARVPANGTFTCKRSGYSRRWNVAVNTFPGTGFIPTSTGIKIVFPKDQQSSDTYQTAWGSPVTSDVTGTLSVAP
ncbi:MAG: carboxypeptidase-like regulatory domain-containing protein [Acidobacteriota bacterium]